METKSEPSIKEVVTMLNDYKPKVYLCKIVIMNLPIHEGVFIYAFSTLLDRIQFVAAFEKYYSGPHNYNIFNSEVQFNPETRTTIDQINEKFK